MNKEQAIVLLLQVAEVAQQRGLFTLKEAVAFAQAVEVLSPEQTKSETEEIK